MIKLAPAQPEDAGALTDVQIKAFKASTEKTGRVPGSEPRGYNSLEWQQSMITDGTYLKILSGEKIAGGLILFPISGTVFEIDRIYVNRELQNQGIGKAALESLVKELPEVTKWTTGAPEWNTGVHRFFEKCGYKKCGERSIMEGNREFRFEKKVSVTNPPGRSGG